MGGVCIVDNSLVFGKCKTNHWRRLKTVFKKIERTEMTLRKDKGEFEKSSVRFLGHVAGGGIIAPGPATVEVILNLNPPIKREHGVLWELVNYLGKFSKNLTCSAMQ